MIEIVGDRDYLRQRTLIAFIVLVMVVVMVIHRVIPRFVVHVLCISVCPQDAVEG